MLSRHDYDNVRRILLTEWDPIGIVALGGPPDEYDSYIAGVVRLLQKGCTADEMTAHLHAIEIEQMGIGPSPDTPAAAQSLLRLDLG